MITPVPLVVDVQLSTKVPQEMVQPLAPASQKPLEEVVLVPHRSVRTVTRLLLVRKKISIKT